MDSLKALGDNYKYQTYAGRDATLLEKFRAPEVTVQNGLRVTIMTSEFTCLCPKTGQPDYASIRIHYTPRAWCVESKSLKLYLMSFRNEGIFHEECVAAIGRALVELLDPASLEVIGEFAARGGIAFQPTFTYTCGCKGD